MKISAARLPAKRGCKSYAKRKCASGARTTAAATRSRPDCNLIAWSIARYRLYRWASITMHFEYLRKHINVLVALSHVAKDRAVSARLRELADECRIMLSLAEVSEVVAGIIKSSEVKSPDE